MSRPSWLLGYLPMIALAALVVSLAGYAVPVQCLPSGQMPAAAPGLIEAGQTQFDSSGNATAILLNDDVICRPAVAALSGSHATQTSPTTIVVWSDAQEGAALVTALHEAMHARLHSRDEALVECSAMERFQSTVRPFAHDGKQLMAWEGGAWSSHLATPASYQGPCDDGFEAYSLRGQQSPVALIPGLLTAEAD